MKRKLMKKIKNECREYVIGLMTAFRIFYVGCSRAKKIYVL